MLESWGGHFWTKLFPSFLYLFRDLKTSTKSWWMLTCRRLQESLAARSPAHIRSTGSWTQSPDITTFTPFRTIRTLFSYGRCPKTHKWKWNFLSTLLTPSGFLSWPFGISLYGQWLIRNMWTFKSLFVLLYRVTSAAICFEDMSELLSPIHRTLQLTTRSIQKYPRQRFRLLPGERCAFCRIVSPIRATLRDEKLFRYPPIRCLLKSVWQGLEKIQSQCT